MRNTVVVTNAPEIELQWEARVAPYRPAVTGADPDDCHPEEGGEVEDVRLVLGPAQADSVRRAVGTYLAGGDTSDSATAYLVESILRDGLDARHIDPDPDEFIEAIGTERDCRECAADEAAEARAEDDRIARERGEETDYE